MGGKRKGDSKTEDIASTREVKVKRKRRNASSPGRQLAEMNRPEVWCGVHNGATVVGMRIVKRSVATRHELSRLKKMIMIKEGVGVTSVRISHRPRSAQITDGRCPAEEISYRRGTTVSVIKIV